MITYLIFGLIIADQGWQFRWQSFNIQNWRNGTAKKTKGHRNVRHKQMFIDSSSSGRYLSPQMPFRQFFLSIIFQHRMNKGMQASRFSKANMDVGFKETLMISGPVGVNCFCFFVALIIFVIQVTSHYLPNIITLSES